MSKFLNAYKVNPTLAIQTATAEFAKMVYNESTTGGASNAVSNVLLNKFMAQTLPAIVNQTVLIGYTNQEGSYTDAGYIQYTVLPFGNSQAKGNQKDLNRFKTVIPFVSMVYLNNIREFPYENQNKFDWTVAGLTSLFTEFWGTVKSVIMAEIEDEVVNLLTLNTPTYNRSFLVPSNVVGASGVTNVVEQLDADIRKISTLGINPVSATNVQAIEQVIRRGLNPDQFVIMASVETFQILANTLKYKVYGGAVSAEEFIDGKAFNYALIGGEGKYAGLHVIKNPSFDKMGVNYSLVAKGKLNGIGFGFAYDSAVLDKMPGSTSLYLGNHEYRYGAGLVYPLNGLFITSFRTALENGNVNGVVSIGAVTTGATPTVQFTGTVQAGSALTDITYAATVYNATTGVIVGTAITVTPDSDGNFAVTSGNLVSGTKYIVTLSATSTIGTLTAAPIYSIYFDTPVTN